MLYTYKVSSGDHGLWDRFQSTGYFTLRQSIVIPSAPIFDRSVFGEIFTKAFNDCNLLFCDRSALDPVLDTV